MSARHGTTDRVRRVTAPAAIALVLAFAAPTGAATRVLAVGDFGVGGSTERATGAAIKTWEADHPAGLLLTLGDNDYTESPPAFRRSWHDAFGWLEAAGVRPRGTLGNHDVRGDGGRYEFKALHMPSSHYQRSRKDFDLFVLNSSATASPSSFRATTSSRPRSVISHSTCCSGGPLALTSSSVSSRASALITSSFASWIFTASPSATSQSPRRLPTSSVASSNPSAERKPSTSSSCSATGRRACSCPSAVSSHTPGLVSATRPLCSSSITPRLPISFKSTNSTRPS